MPDIVLNDVTNTNQLSVINSNFDKIETQLNDFAIDRTDVGVMESDIDMNGNRIYNLPQPILDNEPVRLIDLRSSGGGGGSVISGVNAFNGRVGDVVLSNVDISSALGFSPASLSSPNFIGVPTVPTPVQGTNTSQIASTAFVQQAVTSNVAGVVSFNTRTGAVTLNGTDITNALGFVPSPLASPTFTGVPSGPTATIGTNTTQLATTEFVQSAVAASTTGVSAFNTRTGNVTLTSSDVTTALTYTPANIVSPSFTGTPTAPTQLTSDDSTKIATTAFVKAAVAGSTTGVASFNTRTGAVTLTGNDVKSALETAMNAGPLTIATTAASSTATSLYLTRNASYTGGTQGYVNSALFMDTTAGAGNTSFEWGFTSRLNNYAGGLTENVGAYFQGNKYSTGSTFGSVSEVCDMTNAATGINSGGVIGMEVDVWCNGPDTGSKRVGIDLVVGNAQSIRGLGSGIGKGISHAGMRIYPYNGNPVNGEFVHGIIISSATSAGLVNNATGTWGIRQDGNYVVGVDLSASTNSDSAIRIKANDWISLSADSSVKLRYNSGLGRIEFFGNGTGRGFIDVVSGSNVDLASGSGGGSFVDLTTDQTVGGIKTFSGPIIANGGIISNDITLAASNTLNWISSGNISGTVGALNGYLRIKIDGNTFKIPFYNP